MEKFDVKGMTCAACAARVEKAAKDVDGVEKAEVNLLLNTLSVEDSSPATAENICAAVKKAGYSAEKSGVEKASEKGKGGTIRLIASIIFTLPLFYCHIHMAYGAPIMSFLHDIRALAVFQLLLSTAVIALNFGFFARGFKAAIGLHPNMDSLVAMGSSVAYIYSLVMTFIIFFGNTDVSEHSLYYETAAMILTLISVGKLLEAKSKGKAADAIGSLMKLAPMTATILVDGAEKTIPVEELKVGDLFLVRPAASIPADGVVMEGRSSVDCSALTGESMPVDKTTGDKVNAATLNLYGALICKAEKVGSETNFHKIIETVKEASAGKAPIARIADKVAGIFTPVVLGIALMTCVVWLLVDGRMEFALARAISVLVISCPCALGLATPVAIMVGGGRAAKEGILFKTAEIMENSGKIDVFAFDKTGTLTEGKPKVTDVIPSKGTTKEELIEYAVSAESLSEHPISRAITALSDNKGSVEDFRAEIGLGVECRVNGYRIIGGNLAFMQKEKVNVEYSTSIAERLAEEGKTPIFFAKDGKELGIIAVADVLKEDAVEAIRKLKEAGIYTVMLTGDNVKTAKAVAEKAGLDNFAAELLPEDKASVIEVLRSHGKTAMVGDGINDAPSLTVADVGVAIGRGTDVAIDSADVVLTSSSTKDVVKTFALSKKILGNIKQNLFFAFIYNALAIPIAAGVFVPLGFTLDPTIGAIAMSLSSFSVVSNALRLNFIKINKIKANKNKIEIEEDLSSYGGKTAKEFCMKKTLTIEGMMCEHCKARVEKALGAVDGIEKAEVNLKKGTATVKFKEEIANEILKKAVEEQGYTVKNIE